MYIVPKDNNNLFKKKLQIKTTLEDTLYKPVDVVVASDQNRLIEKEALKGIIL